MRVRHVIWGSLIMMLAVGVLKGQSALLSTIEAPYPAVQSPVKIAGSSYGAGAVAYGPVGTPLILSGKNFGAMGTVLFPGPQKGTTVAATVTSWSSSILFLKVPAGATSGLVYVSNGAKQSNGLPFIVTLGSYMGSCPVFPPANQLEITTASLPNGRLGQSYGVTLNAEGGAPPYSWSLSGGSLPAGLSLASSSGVISGTPATVTGEVSLRLKATDSQGQSTEAMLSMAVDSQLLTAGMVYSYTVGADGYDGTGNVTSYTDTVMGKWSFGYDGLSRLMSAAPGTGVPDSYVGQNLCMNYDAFGNQTQASFQQNVCNPATDAATTRYTGNNQISWTAKNSVGTNTHYDTAGNVVYDGSNYYAYDGEGRICAMQSPLYGGGYLAYAYIYDAEGRRVAKGSITPIDLGTQKLTCSMQGFQLTESYTLGVGGEQLTVSGGDGSWKWTNVYGAGKLIATYDGNGEHYQLSDPLGTRRMQTSSNGEAELACQSLPFGDQQYCYTVPNAPPTADDATSLHFTGKERDTESGNDYFGARYYGASMGRFLSPDPLFVTKARLADPQQWNRYTYALNNPLRIIDPDGMDATIIYSYGQDLTEAQRKWFLAHQNQVLDAIRAKLNKAGIKNVTFKDSASLSSSDLKALASSPAQADQGKTGTPGVIRLEFDGGQASFANQEAPLGTYGFTNHGRVAVFMSNLLGENAAEQGTADCDAACGVANVASHEIGHGFGFEAPGHTANPILNFFGITPQWPAGIWPDLMKQGQNPFSRPLDYRRDPNIQAIDEVNRAKTFP